MDNDFNIKEPQPSGILIWGEKKLNGELAQVVFELVSKSKQLLQNKENNKITVITAGELSNLQQIKDNLAKYGADELVIIKSPLLEQYNTRSYSDAVTKYLKDFPKEIFLIGATKQGRDLAPQISSAMQTGLTADCTGLEITNEGKLAATRPTFGGELMATIMCKTYPQMATVRPKIFKSQIIDEPTEIFLNEYYPQNIQPSLKKVIKSIPISAENNKLENAKIVLAGGKGLKDKETFNKLYKLANLLGAEVAASRKAVDAGLANHDIQVGQTGKTISPDLYIAFGISGAIQHCVGISRSKRIIAINSDINAPIAQSADTLIVGDAKEIINSWINELQ